MTGISKKPLVVYYSSTSNNTARFVEKLDCNSIRIPIKLSKEISVSEEYILITPTYSGGHGTTGAVPKQVIHFLNKLANRQKCIRVIASGNTNFGNSFALAGDVISKKLHVPYLYKFELLGTTEDVNNVNKIIADAGEDND